MGKEVILGILQEQLSLAKIKSSGNNFVRDALDRQRFLGNTMLYDLNGGNKRMSEKLYSLLG